MGSEVRLEDLWCSSEQLAARSFSGSFPQEYECWQGLFCSGCLDSLPTGIAVLNTDFVLLQSNRAYAGYLSRYSPLGPGQALGRCYFDFIPGSKSQLEGWFREVRDLRRAETRYNYQLQISTAGSDELTFWDAHVRPLVSSGDQTVGLIIFCLDVTSRNEALNVISEKNREVDFLGRSLHDSRKALKHLLGAREELRRELEEAVTASTHDLILPLLERLKNSTANQRQHALVQEIESCLLNVAASFPRKLSSPAFDLTPREILVAGLIRSGKTSKEIADMLGVGTSSIDFHRNNIRRKLGMTHNRANLRSFLMTL
jgi:DNA-binding CsgD family transcriptional regulator